MFKFVAVSLLALALTACAGKEEEVAVEAVPAAEETPVVEAAPAAEASAEVPAEGVSATAVAPADVATVQ